MAPYPATLECPFCKKMFKQRALSKNKLTVCVYCGRLILLWEARFFKLISENHMEDVTDSMIKMLEKAKERYELRKRECVSV